MFFFDAHLDLAWNAIEWNRDLTRTCHELRKVEMDRGLTFKARCANTVTLPDLRQGKVGIVIGTLLARVVQEQSNPSFCRYDHMEAAQAAAMGQLAWYAAMERRGDFRWIKGKADLEASISDWSAASHEGKTPIGMILSMEGADPVLDPSELPMWFEKGLRIIGPAHYGVSPYAHGTATIGGLFSKGPDLLKNMEKLGIILDVTHLADQAFDEAMSLYQGPVLASHHNCRALVDDQRQLSDDQIRRLIERGAVIGAAMDTWMLVPGWKRGTTTVESTGVGLRHVADHIDHICQLAGNVRHVGIGSDLDGGFGLEQSPGDLDTIADLSKLCEILRQRGYSQIDLEAIAHGNWIRFFRQNLA
jgi:membrane dipeptidase